MEESLIVKTEDNSNTLFSELYGEHYHSTFGAKNESQHIYIDAGLRLLDKTDISIFEMGFGTGLNAYLSFEYARLNNKKIKYSCIEKYPINKEIYHKLDYASDFGLEVFNNIHQLEWEKWNVISDYFKIKKENVDLALYRHTEQYDLVYFDAFSPDSQPELWTEEIFSKLYKQMNSGGILMTYSVKGIVKRALKVVGFKIEKVPGPKGKREILRAVKD